MELIPAPLVSFSGWQQPEKRIPLLSGLRVFGFIKPLL
jgi:hypothetical protein